MMDTENSLTNELGSHLSNVHGEVSPNFSGFETMRFGDNKIDLWKAVSQMVKGGKNADTQRLSNFIKDNILQDSSRESSSESELNESLLVEI